MAKDKKQKGKAKGTSDVSTGHYQHRSESRKNNPTAFLAGEAKVPKASKVRFEYDPHLSPVLRSDTSGAEDKLPELLEKATRKPLSEEEARLIANALRNREPWLEWSGKQERLS